MQALLTPGVHAGAMLFELHIPGGNVGKRNVFLMTAIISYSYSLYEPRSIMVALEKAQQAVLY